MKLETVETKLDTEEDVWAVAKRWYTEQRGRRLGNTTAWDDLNANQKFAVFMYVETTLKTFRAVMEPEPTPVERRQR